MLEQTLRWEQLGRTRQSTPDARGPYHVAEIKTGRCVEPGKFVRDGGFRSYHVQLADQCAAIEAVTGKWPEESYIVAVESVPPYVVTVFQVTDHTLVKGRRLAELWLAKLISCERSGEWPAYSTGIEVFDIPDDGLDLAYDTELDTPAWKRGAEPGADE